MVGRVAGVWAVPWDSHVSRQHARLQWTGTQLRVTELSNASNPVYFRGKPTPRFTMRPASTL